jgi:hypothetical protein
VSVATVEPASLLPRRIPTRSWEPPYDDELPPSVVVEGSLALDHPALERPSEALRLVPAGTGPADDEQPETIDGPQRTPRSALPDPKPWAGRLVQALVEVLAGDRPAAQLAPYTSLGVYRGLERRGGRWPQAVSLRPVVRSVHVSEPMPSVVEACAVIDTGQRRRAIAARFEGLDGRWQCTALQLC